MSKNKTMDKRFIGIELGCLALLQEHNTKGSRTGLGFDQDPAITLSLPLYYRHHEETTITKQNNQHFKQKDYVSHSFITLVIIIT
jgi:hypothetical protein